jgi:hypothetical protein
MESIFTIMLLNNVDYEDLDNLQHSIPIEKAKI